MKAKNEAGLELVNILRFELELKREVQIKILNGYILQPTSMINIQKLKLIFSLLLLHYNNKRRSF